MRLCWCIISSYVLKSIHVSFQLKCWPSQFLNLVSSSCVRRAAIKFLVTCCLDLHTHSCKKHFVCVWIVYQQPTSSPVEPTAHQAYSFLTSVNDNTGVSTCTCYKSTSTNTSLLKDLKILSNFHKSLGISREFLNITSSVNSLLLNIDR